MNRYFILVIVFFCLIVFTLACDNTILNNSKSDKYELNIKFYKDLDSWVILYGTVNEDLIVIDSVPVVNGNLAKFTGNLTSSELMYLYICELNKFIPIFMQNTKFDVFIYNNNIKKSKIKGGELQNKFETFLQNFAIYDNKVKNIENEIKKSKQINDTTMIIHLDSIKETLISDKITYIKKYVLSNNESVISAYITSRYLTKILSAHELSLIYNSFTEKIKKHKYSKQIIRIINLKSTLEKSNPLPNELRINNATHNYNYILISWYNNWDNIKYFNNIDKEINILNIQLVNQKPSNNAILVDSSVVHKYRYLNYPYFILCKNDTILYSTSNKNQIIQYIKNI